MVPADGGTPRQLTTAQSSTAPRWSPDGRGIAFLSTRASPGETTAKPQVYLLPLDGGEAHRLTSLANGVTAFTWSPDGARLACLGRAGTADRPTDTRHYFASFYKFNGRSFFDTLRTHIWVTDARGQEARQSRPATSATMSTPSGRPMDRALPSPASAPTRNPARWRISGWFRPPAANRSASPIATKAIAPRAGLRTALPSPIWPLSTMARRPAS